MKKIIYLLLLLIAYCSCNTSGHPIHEKDEVKNEKVIVVDAVFKGTWQLSGTEYFLIDIEIINSTYDSVTFLTYSCSTGINIVTDLKNFIVHPNVCSRNVPAIVLLGPGQKFTTEAILNRTLEDNKSYLIKIGWILIIKNQKNIENLDEYIEEYKKSLKSIIWSKPIRLDEAYSQTYEVH